MERQTKNRAAKAGISAAALTAVLACLPAFEGVVLKGYRDPVGIVTACIGETKTAILGKAYTRDECIELLEKRVIEHGDGISRCVDLNRLTIGQQAASISFSYNIGVAAFCRSTYARKLPDVSACAELSRWTHAGGRELPGLVKRRASERAMCEGRISYYVRAPLLS